MYSKVFIRKKGLTCPECAQLSFVYCVQETCGERFILHYSVTFCSTYINDSKETKNTLNMTSSVYFPYLCAELVQPSTLLPHEYTSGKQNTRQIALFRCYLKLCTQDLKPRGLLNDRTVAKVMHYAHDTKVWLVQNMHNSVSCMRHVQSDSFCTMVSAIVQYTSLSERKLKTP